MSTVNKLEEGAMQKYDLGYKFLHWSMAMLIFLMFFAAIGFAKAITEEERLAMLTGHSSIGILISLLLVLRVTKRFIKKSPTPVQSIAQWNRLAAKVVQRGLYFCMIYIPVTGFLTARLHELPVRPFGLINISQSQQGFDQSAFFWMRLAHEAGIKLIMLLLVLHIGAALYHRVYKKDNVLKSMLPFKR